VADERRGTAYGVACYLLWGLFPLYWPLLEPAGAIEILSHRIVWSLVFVVGVLAATHNWAWLRQLRRDPATAARLTAAAVLIAGNWALYIWGVNNEHVVETSLGYFVNPIVTVLMGVLLLHERLRPVQWAAIGLGAAAVVVLTVDYGRPPWIALGLAFSFGTYGLLKKRVGAQVGAVQSLSFETAVLFVPALAYLVALEAGGDGQLGHSGVGHGLLLASAGVVTAVPLLFFAGAARRVPLTTMGLLQYLTPVIQLVIGVLVYDEPMPASRLAGFSLVWAALLILSADALRNGHRNRARDGAAAYPASAATAVSTSASVE
jgi:chloramphenicol-sensitive protein RarD